MQASMAPLAEGAKWLRSRVSDPGGVQGQSPWPCFPSVHVCPPEQAGAEAEEGADHSVQA